MDISTAVLNTDVETARAKWQEYATAAKGQPSDAQLELAARTFHQMALGKQVIDVRQAIVSGGLLPRGLPALAIARAHWRHVHAWWSGGRVTFTGRPRIWSTRGEGQQRRQNPSVQWPRMLNFRDGSALVPSVPPGLRPPGGADILTRYHILFEAEWDPVPPTDPMLLSHLGGPFYVVRAHWALTPLERALLRDET
jgi:hypothetical protein